MNCINISIGNTFSRDFSRMLRLTTDLYGTSSIFVYVCCMSYCSIKSALLIFLLQTDIRWHQCTLNVCAICLPLVRVNNLCRKRYLSPLQPKDPYTYIQSITRVLEAGSRHQSGCRDKTTWHEKIVSILFSLKTYTWYQVSI